MDDSCPLQCWIVSHLKYYEYQNVDIGIIQKQGGRTIWNHLFAYEQLGVKQRRKDFQHCTVSGDKLQ